MPLSQQKIDEFVEEITKDLHQQLIDNIQEFLIKKKISQAELARIIGCTKGHVTQIFKGNPDHKLSKLALLALITGKKPVIRFEDIPSYRLNLAGPSIDIDSLS